MNIFVRELKANRKALIIWSVCMVLLIVSGMGKYTAYSGGGATGDVFAKMPTTLKALLGFGSLDVTVMSGFFAVIFLYIELTAAIHAVLLGSGIIAKEERDKTTEFLIVKPVSRFTIITQKLFAALFNIVVLNIVTLLTCIPIVASFNKSADITGEIIVFDLSLFIIQLIFLTLGALLAACIRRPKTSGSIGAGILMAGYVISKVTDINDRLNALNILSPFKYFDYAKIANGGGLNLFIVLLTILLCVVFTVTTYYFYLKRDLNI